VSGGFGSDKNILSSAEVYDPGKFPELKPEVRVFKNIFTACG
jgi:hypothetical protein